MNIWLYLRTQCVLKQLLLEEISTNTKKVMAWVCQVAVFLTLNTG